jgi:hypothetical protein
MKVRSPSNRAAPAARAGAVIPTRLPGASVSGSRKAVSARLSSASAASTPKMPRQPTTCITPLPASGASIGEIEMTSITIAISRVAAGPECRSRMIARGTTITVAAPSPCTKRAATSAPMVGASAQASEPTRKIPTPR